MVGEPFVVDRVWFLGRAGGRTAAGDPAAGGRIRRGTRGPGGAEGGGGRSPGRAAVGGFDDRVNAEMARRRSENRF